MIAGSRVQAWHQPLLIGSIAAISVVAWLVLWQFNPAVHGHAHHHTSSALLFVGAWTVMTIAMMLPTSIPLVATFDTIAGDRTDRPLLVGFVIAGYLGAWMLAGCLVYAAGALVQRLASANPWLREHATAGSAALLLTAGLYQFTPLKRRCLDKCRSPLSFVLGYWQGDRDRRNALLLGVHHGVFCIGCCWALMLVMFAVGVASLGWMLLLGAVMAIEKNVPWGRRLSAPVGSLLVAGSVLVAVFS
jgi:predicted metal-binding membrane protein